MMKFLLVTLFATFNLCVITEAAPSTDGINHLANSSDIRFENEIPVRYDGAQLWSVEFSDDRSKRIVVDLKRQYDIALWSLNGSAVYVFLKQSAVEGVTRVLQNANVSYSIVIPDLQKQIEVENPSQEEIEILQNRNGHRLTWRAYHRIADIYSFLDYLTVTYPDLCSVETIGHSHERRPIKVLRISNGNSRNKAIWIDGGIHAREWISSASVTYFVNDLMENWDNQPSYIRNINWYIAPLLNPDGYEYTHRTDRLWRKNRSPGSGGCGGVDLNRNFGYKWGGKGTSQNPCQEIYAGRSAFSEPESLATKRFFDKTKEQFHGYLTFHSYGQYILHPWGYEDVVPPDYEDLDRVGKEAARNMKAIDSAVYKVGPSAALLYPPAGGSDDWAKSLGVKYSYTVELRDRGRYGFILPATYIEVSGREAEQFIFTVARAVANIKQKQ